MENKINIAEILKDKPVGTKLYSPICGRVSFDKIERDLGHYTIFVTTPAQTHYTFMEDGKYERNGECLLFPSNEIRDWSKFAWKKGDVLVSNDKHKEVIFAGFADDTYTRFKAKHILVDEGYEGIEYSGDGVLQTQNYSLEAKDAAHCYINTIEERFDGKLNMETLEIEDIKPKWTPKPFDKVIVRNGKDYYWKYDLFSNYIEGDNYPYVCVGLSYKECIPYNEETAKLIGTTDNWED